MLLLLFPIPLSNSGHLAPVWALSQKGETPDVFFKKTIFTYSHDNSINAVANHLVDGAAVDSLVFDFMLKQNPELGNQVRIVDRLGPYGIPPVVVHPDIDPQLKATLHDVLLTMADSPEGEIALEKLNIERFVDVDPVIYDSLRMMAGALRGWDDSP